LHNLQGSKICNANNTQINPEMNDDINFFCLSKIKNNITPAKNICMLSCPNKSIKNIDELRRLRK